MKKIYAVFLWGIVVQPLLPAQTVSPLFQVMSSNSLINALRMFDAHPTEGISEAWIKM